MHGYRGKIKGSHGIYVTSPLWQLYHSQVVTPWLGSYTMGRYKSSTMCPECKVGQLNSEGEA